MKKTLMRTIAGYVILCCLALTLGCGCLCGGGKGSSEPGSVGAAPSRSPGQNDGRAGELWRFVVSGDSRNCGDVVMPAIAEGARKDHADFYWHLGDLRAIYDFDEDMVQAAQLNPDPAKQHLNIISYEKNAWDDFKSHQIAPFDNVSIPFYLGIGNHETIPPKTRCEFAGTFSTWLKKPEFEDANLSLKFSRKKAPAAAPSDECEQTDPRTYYHWIVKGIDFIYLDNASNEQFDKTQLDWFDSVIKQDAGNKNITTVVVGMHKALPWSVACDHSMNESPEGTKSGEHVYASLVELQKKDTSGNPGKKVYVLASHSHYFMFDIYNTRRWRDQILPGWIVGTAGAQRYPLPDGADMSKSKTYVYGYLLARVYPGGIIDFAFTQLDESDIPSATKNAYTENWINDTCFGGNRSTEKREEPQYCKGNNAP